jgi:hypothetical protein
MITTEVSDIDAVYALIASVYRRAIKDATRRGDKEAIQFLDITAPDWRELAKRADTGRRDKPLFLKRSF